jgi:hypothetical protein
VINLSVTQLRKLRTMVRHTLNLVSVGIPMKERMGTWWRVDLETREVEWTPFLPFPPHSLIDDKASRYLIAHEASHAKWSGRYTTKQIKDSEKRRFHRFVNAVEDIRCDRLSEQQFLGYNEAKLHIRRLLRRNHQHTGGWSLVDGVGLNSIYSFDIGMPVQGNDLVKEAATRLWPKIDRIGNVRSTQEVATALEPIFRELVKIEEEEAERKRREEEERRRREEEERQKELERRRQEQEERERREREEREAAEAAEQEAEASENTDDDQEEPDGEKGESGEDGGDGLAEPGESEPEDEDEQDDVGADEQAGGDSEQDGEESHSAGGEPDAEDDAEDEEAGEEGVAGGDEAAEEPDTDGGQDDQTGPGGVEAAEQEAAADADEEAEDDVDDETEHEEEDTEPPDPLAGLDELPDDVGADEPTDKPICSDGEDGTDPLAIGDDIDGIAEDATDQATRDDLERLSRGNEAEKAQAQALVDKRYGKRHPSTEAGVASYDRELHAWRGRIHVLATRLKTTLRHNSMTNPQSGQRRGRFDPGKAYRLRTGSIKVFQQPGVIGGTDYTFGLLVDASGSMFSFRRDDNGDTIVNPDGSMPPTEAQSAFEACVLVAEALEEAGLGVFLIFWDKEMRHVKPLYEPLRIHRGPIGAIMGASGGGSDTIESPAIGRALEEFEFVPHGRRMLITITDGATSTKEESKELLEELEQQGVRCLTIRIGDEPGDHYQRGYRVEHADELVKLLPRIVNEVVSRGG